MDARRDSTSGWRRTAGRRPGWWLPLSLCALLVGPALASDLDLYEWSARAPLIVTGHHVGEDGRYIRIGVDRVLRGDAVPGTQLLLDLREANRSRDTALQRRRLRLDPETRYMLLLRQAYVRNKDGRIIYILVRGIDGARPLPTEGAEATLAALATFIEVQDLNGEAARWQRFEQMLEGTDPLAIEVALDQFLKFRRGDDRQLALLTPLLDHPNPRFREKAARLMGEIVERQRGAADAGGTDVRAALVARARRDESVDVRVAATNALGAFGPERSRGILEEIARDDPQQEVRYAAEVLLLRFDERAGDRGTARN